ncbi:hypothetical protein EDB92DRAFT_1819314 [Lactarius akahatsu]|uniref:Uncharacterized protein n=1 Tax=Lactarius akahatsu TaxID=416441 RepID=A0AAD4Q771_9AGAM|nr:hypothetical protein EDB92DRAFT_1819314 [Lactarius akahatsu]
MSSHIGKKFRPRLSSKEQYHSSLRIVARTGVQHVVLVPSALPLSGTAAGLIHAPEMNLQNITGTRQREPHLLQRVAEKMWAGAFAIPFLRVLQSIEVPGALPARGVPRLHLDRIPVEDIRAQYTRLIEKIGNGLTIFTSVLVPLYKALKIQLIVAFLVAFTKSQKIVDTGSNPVRVSLVHCRDGRFEAHYEFRRIVAVGSTGQSTKFGITYFTGHSPQELIALTVLPEKIHCFSKSVPNYKVKRQGLAVAAQNLHSDCKMRPVGEMICPAILVVKNMAAGDQKLPELEMIIAKKHHAIEDVVGGTTPEAERVQTWAAKIANGNPDMPMADDK